MGWFDPKTQVYINNALDTLQIWFHADTPSQNTPPPSTGGGTTPPPTTTPKTGGGGGRQDTEKPKSNTMKYVGIGAGVIVLGLVTFVIVKRARKK